MARKMSEAFSLDILVCPQCRGPLIIKEKQGRIVCPRCKEIYSFSPKQIPLLLTEGEKKLLKLQKNQRPGSLVESTKSKLRRKRVYYYLLWLLTTSFSRGREHKFFLKRFKKGAFIVDIGSGAHRVDSRVVTLDIFPGDNIDLVASIYRLPFPDGSVDGIIVQSVLEHLKDPKKALTECHRVLKKNGFVFSRTPFLYPLHGAPEDYFRFTEKGLEEIFSQFKIEKITHGGPGGVVIHVLREYLAILLSFNNQLIYEFLSIFFLFVLVWLLLPLKILDLLLRYYKTTRALAGRFYVIAKKKAL